MKTIPSFFTAWCLFAGCAVADDTEAPQLAALSIDPVSVDATAGVAITTVTLRITDPGAGFLDGSIPLYSATQQWTGAVAFDADQRISGNELDGIYEVEVRVPRYGPPGTWRVGCFLKDHAGNEREYPFDLEFPEAIDETFTVINTGLVDTTKPAVASIGISPAAVEVSAASTTITVTVEIEEDLSGLRDILLFFHDPSGQSHGSMFAALGAAERISGDYLNGTYQVEVTVPQGAANGIWLIRAFLRDRVGNTQYYGPGAAPYPEPDMGEFAVGTVPPSLLDAFLDQYNLTGDDALPGADADDDGKINELELLLGTDPTNPADAGAGLMTLTRDATALHLDFTIDSALNIDVDGLYLELSDGSGGPPLRLTGQTQAAPDGIWTSVLPVSVGGHTYRVSLPFAGGPKAFARLFFRDP